MKCVVGEWLDSLSAERQADFDNALDTLSRVSLHNKIVEDEKGVRPFGLTALKDHLNTKCVCGREVAPKSVTVTTDQKGTYNVQDFKPLTPEGMLEACGLSADEYVVAGEVSCRTRTLANGDVVYAYSFKARPRTDLVDVAWLAERARKAPPVSLSPTNDDVWNFQASDLQIGKIDGYAIDGTLERYWDSVNEAVADLVASGASTAHLVFAGDCIENGGVSQGGTLAWRQSLTITEQVRVWRRLLMETVRRFAPLVPSLHVSVVGGNHDQATRLPVQTRSDDNWATEGALAVQDAAKENPEAFGHVQFHVPEKDCAYMTVVINGVSFSILHGHQFRKGKAAEWWASQAFYGNEPGKSHFMLHGHYHTLSVQQDGPRTIICSPTYDGGSNWYRDLTGAHSANRQGGIVFVATPDGDFRGLRRV